MTEVQILTAIKNNGGSTEHTALLNQNITDFNRDSLADEARIKQMIEAKLLEGDTKPYNLISITENGRLYLQNAVYLEEIKNQETKNIADKISNDKRHDWYIALVSGLVVGILTIVGEIVIRLFF